MTSNQKHYFFVGIGGSGMSALADLIRLGGDTVSGSDRGRDRGDVPEKFKLLSDNGMTLHKQDGSGVVAGVDYVVVSSAVEESIPDIQAARKLGIPVLKRAELLSRLFNASRGIGIAGTSGKTTVTGMTGWMLHAMGLGPTIANGGVMPNFIGHKASLMGNAVSGTSGLFVAEMDESDGTISLFNPSIAVLNNITLDHKPFDVIEPMFRDYLLRAREVAIVNLDDERAAKMAHVHPQTITLGINRPEAALNATNLQHLANGISFDVYDRRDQTTRPVTLKVPGRHNVSNALCALATAMALGEDMDRAISALEQFKGIRRRLEVIGTTPSGITIIDDFGHNPDKIAASLETLTAHPGRVLVMFQPHGFGPMKMMRTEMVESFVKGLRGGDVLMMPEIFYAGGTVTRDISSNDLITDVQKGGRNGLFFNTRADVGNYILKNAQPGDRVVIMGARDDTLTEFASGLLRSLSLGKPSATCSPAP